MLDLAIDYVTKTLLVVFAACAIAVTIAFTYWFVFHISAIVGG
jgi:hypothetical protein